VTTPRRSAILVAMRIFIGAGFLGLVFVLGCSRSGADADAPTTGASGEVVAPVEAEPPANTEAAAVDPSLCVPASYEQWPTCEGKRVQVDGRNPEMVYQHPMMNGPDTEQGYLEVEGAGQIVLVTREPVTCKADMRVIGTLRAIDLGGEPGTKESYKGWVIEDAEVTCR
jgi:hypothetical protein